ncbi:MAG: pro-sigmaK processing inhibitor BofA family protein [Defluviitaleaceae bacterium]|nr:pro-sigmaK processing inhibitor BofA family protein [Defluviitaleaceae bacterium]
MDGLTWLLVALGFGFFAFLFYTRQFRWIGGVLKNSALGVLGILVFNFVLSGAGVAGIAVGVNAVTVLVVGILGVPGFLLLYATRLLL